MRDEPNSGPSWEFGDEAELLRISYTVLPVIWNFFPGLRFAFTGPLTFPREKPELQLVRLIPNRR